MIPCREPQWVEFRRPSRAPLARPASGLRRRLRTHCRFSHRQQNGIWAEPPEALIDAPDLEWLTIDASPVKAHQYGAGAVGSIDKQGGSR